MDERKIIKRLSVIGIVGNILLVAFKLYAGIAGHSGAMVSDAVHSLSDVFATFAAISANTAYLFVLLSSFAGYTSSRFIFLISPATLTF